MRAWAGMENRTQKTAQKICRGTARCAQIGARQGAPLRRCLCCRSRLELHDESFIVYLIFQPLGSDIERRRLFDRPQGGHVERRVAGLELPLRFGYLALVVNMNNDPANQSKILAGV